MNTTTVTTPDELEIRVERIFDAPRSHVFSVWTDPKLIPEWWGDGTVVEEMDVRPGGTYRFRTAYGVVEGEFREIDEPERLVRSFSAMAGTGALVARPVGDREGGAGALRQWVRQAELAGRRLVQANGSSNEGREGLLIDFIVLVEVDCAPGVAFEA